MPEQDGIEWNCAGYHYADTATDVAAVGGWMTAKGVLGEFE